MVDGGLTEEQVYRRLKSLNATQESIESLALWCLHHKAAHHLITSVWISVFRTGQEENRVNLLYLANDVCQRERKKGKDPLKEAFVPRLAEAISLMRHDEKLKIKMQRIVSIWEERQVFESGVMAQFRNALAMTFDDAPETHTKFLLDFEPGSLIGDLEKYEKCEASIERAQALLPAAKFQFEGRLKECLKDRKEGGRILGEVEEATRKMDAFVGALEEQINHHHRLIALMEQARSFYAQQIKDATVVEDAYLKFGEGITKVKEQVEEMLRTGVYPGASPPRDAPSPSVEDDPFAKGVEAAMEDLRRPGNRDLIESHDMDVEAEEDNASPTPLHGHQPPPVVDPRLARQRRQGLLPGGDLPPPPPQPQFPPQHHAMPPRLQPPPHGFPPQGEGYRQGGYVGAPPPQPPPFPPPPGFPAPPQSFPSPFQRPFQQPPPHFSPSASSYNHSQAPVPYSPSAPGAYGSASFGGPPRASWSSGGPAPFYQPSAVIAVNVPEEPKIVAVNVPPPQEDGRGGRHGSGGQGPNQNSSGPPPKVPRQEDFNGASSGWAVRW